ncbi:hypothetical protein LOOC260_109700 [Paucilactobacillus hokkaidonensis JCM 18461]|uniref:Phage protein n=1 Tax=Paucilactobacillus hokkaidonensis JCM 18461 TaxID=1291742 RepID=A0A0A1GX91_9LACO|nr:phage protein [Paucilactobacillus hokkaidonensis]BAP85509.1 hypothetical protein LOOC260_109700 [Paucilactobacillus hokkaidonensis JCM 18461]
MNNETKRDVFERALTEWYDLIFKVGGQGNEAYGYCEFDVTLSKYEKDYDAALPDDLPVIPKAVGEILQSAYGQTNLLGVLDTAKNGYKVSYTLAWIIAYQNTFASAWVLGVWRVEETGEIVKLEVDK